MLPLTIGPNAPSGKSTYTMLEDVTLTGVVGTLTDNTSDWVAKVGGTIIGFIHGTASGSGSSFALYIPLKISLKKGMILTVEGAGTGVFYFS